VLSWLVSNDFLCRAGAVAVSDHEPLRIAMWSGPRNISTALLRSWGNRPDTYVCDEPLYAHYLAQTGKPHPGVDEVLASQEQDWREVVHWLTGPVPEGKPLFYQKHMAHHLLPVIDRGWLNDVVNCFLIRDPREMLTSLAQKLDDPLLEDTGLPQQVEIFEQVRRRTGRIPPVIDSKDVLTAPERVLGSLCAALDVTFTRDMLSWPAGRRETDGVWAKYWYESVEASTGFAPYRPKPDPVPDRLSGLYERCLGYYRVLAPHRLRGD
jgi:hypothetical protein